MAKYKKRPDGRYATTVMVGYKPNGKPNNIFLSAKTEKELRNKVVELKMKMKSGEMVKQSDTLLKDYADSWMETYKASAGINTRAMYNNAVNKHIKPELGHLPLNKIVRSDIQKLINDNQEHPRTCEIIKMTMVQILNSAIEDKLLHENVARKVTLPKRHKAEKRALTELEKEAIKKADFTMQEKSFVLLLFYFGLRRGEVLALTRSDIDFKKKTLTVNKTVVFDVNNPVIKNGAKSDAGNRILPIPESAEPFLREFLKSLDTFYLFPGKNTETLSKT
ncbi:MAG: site-specific integrase, partial [Lachnospiraceae bacterium]|nr:site-specific integrase [Lachnospiraceae bacterium]